jgi:hypothetical protein
MKSASRRRLTTIDKRQRHEKTHKSFYIHNFEEEKISF